MDKICIFQTTDVHCQIKSHDELFWENNKIVFRKCGGYDYLSTQLKELKKKYPHSLLIDTGDMFQGSMLSVETKGKALIPILNAMHYDLYIPGNWEVVFGKKQALELFASLNAPTICANMHHEENGLPGNLIFDPWFIWQVEGLRIGIIGYTDPLVPIRQSPEYSRGIIFTEPEATLPGYIQTLKNEKGCQLVILAGHLGFSQEIALSNSIAANGLDYILGGDTHERVRKPILGKHCPVVEPGAFGSFIGKLILFHEKGVIRRKTYQLLEVSSNRMPDPELSNIIEQVKKPYLLKMNKIVGASSIPLYRYFVIENPIDTLVTDALKWRFPEIEIVLSNGFRFCPPLATANEEGLVEIPHSFLFDMLPVDSRIRTGEVSGAQILDWLEKELNNVFAKDPSERFGGWLVKFKGMQLEFKVFENVGKRVKKVTVGGKSLEKQRIYSVLACEREGDPEDQLCRLTNVMHTHFKQPTLHEVLLEYLKANSPVTSSPRGDAIALDAPATLLSQVFDVDYEFR